MARRSCFRRHHPRPVELLAWFVIAVSTFASQPVWAADAEAPPAVGQPAPDFELPSLTGEPVRLSRLTSQGPVVLVVLRGYPGYQCPLCRIQFADLLKHAQAFADAGSRVVFVYPGPAEGLADHAREFVGKSVLPEHFFLVTDPDYQFTETFHLRWNAPHETAYPSSFVVGREGTVRFALVSKTHGGRAKTSDLLATLKMLSR